ncbi:MAG: GNAT family N-acetyltransferase [Bacteroidia bacterium]
MIKLIRTNSENTDFQKLVTQLDAELKINNGEADSFYAQFNKTDSIKFVVVAFENEIVVGCGAIKEYSKDAMEVKRMFVPKDKRGKGIASKVLNELENWTSDLGFKKCILETGLKQIEAISLYKKSGYKIIPNYGQYENVVGSICFEKEI